MKALPSIGFEQFSGKAGNTVAASNAGGQYLRRRVSTFNPNTVAQQGVRNTLKTLSQGWNGLTEAQRLGWNSAVDGYKSSNVFGNKVKPSGINLFVKLNATLLEVGVASNVSVPAKIGATAVTSVSATAAAGVPALSVVFAPTPIPANHKFIIRASKQMSQGVYNFKGKLVNVSILAAAGVSPNNLLAAYTAKFGALVAGNKIAIEVISVNTVTGEKSLALGTTVVIAA